MRIGTWHTADASATKPAPRTLFVMFEIEPQMLAFTSSSSFASTSGLFISAGESETKGFVIVSLMHGSVDKSVSVSK